MIYGGIYRAICSHNVDPEGLLRIRVKVAAVYGEGNESDWAWPCFPPGWTTGLLSNHVFTDNDTGTGAGGSATETLTHALKKLVPAVLEPVWVMFEAGDMRHPVWMGQWKVTGG